MTKKKTFYIKFSTESTKTNFHSTEQLPPETLIPSYRVCVLYVIIALYTIWFQPNFVTEISQITALLQYFCIEAILQLH